MAELKNPSVIPSWPPGVTGEAGDSRWSSEELCFFQVAHRCLLAQFKGYELNLFDL